MEERARRPGAGPRGADASSAPDGVHAPGHLEGLPTEVLLVLGVSLGASATYSVVRLMDRLTRAQTLASQTATLNASASDRPWLDLTYQLLDIGFALVPVALALFLLGGRSVGAGARMIGLGLSGGGSGGGGCSTCSTS